MSSTRHHGDPAAPPRPATGGVVTLSSAAVLHAIVTDAGRQESGYRFARSAEEVVVALETATPAPRAIILDSEHPEAGDALRCVVASPMLEHTLVIVVTRDATKEAPPGAHIVVTEGALRHALALAELPRDPPVRSVTFDRLLTVSVLTGQLDQALELAADEVAAGFGVERCVISVRGDSTGGAAGGAHTWDSLAWDRTAGRFRAASASQATLIAPTSTGSAACESYLAVPLDSPLGTYGFLGLVAERPVRFGREQQAALRATAARLGTELSWRAVHQRTTEELERLASAPGQDLMLGIWNRLAMAELARTHVSGSKRSGLPLAVAVVDVLDLQAINHRYGLDTGDRLLRRIADATRTTIRTEDIVGRWAGDKIAVILHGTTIEGAQRVAERLRAALDARPLELPSGDALVLPITVGIAALTPNEDAAPLVERAVHAARVARDDKTLIGRASTRPVPRISQQLDIGDELRAMVGGSYRLQHEISRGGMGVVYRAEDLALERPVAIKMLRPDLSEDRAFVEQLRIEAAMLARLQHPNLVQIYSFGQSGADSYFVMELVEGEGLQQAIERHRLEGTQVPLSDLVAVIDEIASALDALHDLGIVHRDVKPANVIRDPFRNRAVLVDVGIAHRYGQFVEAAGTPGYVAPEVIAGRAATPRADVYGLAATAYTLLTLTAPWGDDADVMARQTSGTPVVAPSAYRPDIAAADDVLVAALASDPDLRPASAGLLAHGLRSALSVAPSAPKPESPRWRGNVVLPRRAVAKSRGVVFRSVTRALGVRDAQRLRDGIGGAHPDLANALTDTAPLAWLPTELFSRLLAIASTHVDRNDTRLARDIARATVRASFRRFFPASVVTLAPERTLSAIRNVWSQYQSWGAVSSMPVNPSETVVRIADALEDPELCVWTEGLLEQLVTLSGGRGAIVAHEECLTRGDPACLYRVSWDRQP